MSQLRKIRYRLMAWRRFPPLQPAKENIDVVIPIVKKDLAVLPLCLKGVRRQVQHPIKNIYIVAPNEQEIVDFCSRNQLTFIDELTVFGFSPKSLNIRVTEKNGLERDRSGWLFQQLVKLSGCVGTERYYLTIDADHVLIRPHVFLTESRQTVCYMSYEEHQPYYDNIRKLMPGLRLDKLSYVDHKMLFDKQQLQKLHEELTRRFGCSWTEAIVQNYDRSSFAGFSEFELYGNFLTNKVQRPWLQKRLRYKQLADYATLCKQWQRSRWSLTFPDYING